MSRTWGSFLQKHRAEKQVRQAIADGNLYFAADHASKVQLANWRSGSNLVRQLTEALIARSRECSLQGNMAGAWKDLTVASTIVQRNDFDRLAAEKSSLVELTLESANALLLEGRLSCAQRVVRELRSRQILDWRADQIEKSVVLMQQADDYLAKGELRKATDRLMEARNLRPDLTLVESKLAGIQTRMPQFRALKTALRHALLQNNQSEIERCCHELLEIAPCYQVAIDARRRLMDGRRQGAVQWRTEEPVHIKGTLDERSEMPEREDEQTESKPVRFEYIPQNKPLPPTQHKTKIAVTPPPVDEPVEQAVENENEFTGVAETPDEPSAVHENVEESDTSNAEQPFMLWVDGVGGYLVCPGPLSLVGQAVPGHCVQIPMRGDLLSQHVAFENSEQAIICRPIGATEIEGSVISEPSILQDGQQLKLGPIQLRFAQSHPLSGTGLLSFESRHRTHPWSDGVLLVNGPIILGGNRKNHVNCRGWDRELLLFQRNGKWWVRTTGKIEVDGAIFENEAELTRNSRISGEDFSLSLEAL